MGAHARADVRPDRRVVARWALAGCLAVVLAMTMVFAQSGEPPLSLIQPGADSRTALLISEDFPTAELPDGPGLDGSIFYVMARDPLHPTDVAESLGNPRYRMQRPLLSWGAWMLHPTGGGTGLIFALAAVGLAGLFIGGLATGTLSRSLGGPAWVAALFPLLPGSWWCLRTTAADALALGLALAAIACASRSRLPAAVGLGVLAVLAKEPAILVLGGWWLAHRTRRNLSIVAVPAGAIIAWMAFLAATVPPDRERLSDLAPPFLGLFHAGTDIWSGGEELGALASITGAVAIGVAALVTRGIRHPLGWAIVLQLGFLSIMGPNPTGITYGATRMTAGVMIIGFLCILTPQSASNGSDTVLNESDHATSRAASSVVSGTALGTAQ